MPTDILSDSSKPKEGALGSAPHLDAEHVDGQQELAERTRQLDEMRAENARLKSEVAELEAELSALAYSVSHDLRAPLRSVEGFSELLIKEHMAELPENAQHFLQLVHRNAQEMEELLTEVLAYSRLLRQPLHRERVDVRAIAQEAYDELGQERTNRKVDFTIGDMPVCSADRGLVKQVFLILLSNALKFTRKNESASIHVAACREQSNWVVVVKDDGVGFDSRRATKLFTLFRRYHHPDSYEGRGVGLAIAARIVKAHGGRIWAEAAEGRGASFFFTLGDPSEVN